MDQLQYVCFNLSDTGQMLDAQSRFGISSRSKKGNNFLFVHHDAGKMTGLLDFIGENNTVYIGTNCHFHGEVLFHGDNSVVEISDDHPTLSAQINVYSRSACKIGEGTIIYGLRAWISDGKRLDIGKNCLFSEDIFIRTTDHHTIFDLATSRSLNKSNSISIASNVWLGQRVAVMKGANIGEGSIIAGNAVVTKPVPPFELWGGVPARMIRQGVSWLTAHPATAEEIKARQRELGLNRDF